jgi:hypothetical protein
VMDEMIHGIVQCVTLAHSSLAAKVDGLIEKWNRKVHIVG